MRGLTLAAAVLLCGCKSSPPPFVTPPVAVTVGGVPLAQNRNAAIGCPSVPSGDILISRDQYLIAWNPKRRELDWSAWQVAPSDLGPSERSNDFEEDSDLAKAAPGAVEPDEYKGSCLDRGHQTPSADRTDSEAHNAATFLMSNMIPQTAYLNRVTWEHLEEHERDLVKAGGSVYVFAGPVFGTNPPGIGPKGDIAVPAKNFKVIADAKGNVLVAVVMPNVTSKGTDPVKDRAQACADSRHEMLRRRPKGGWTDWQAFETTVADIEAQSGLRFPFLTEGKK